MGKIKRLGQRLLHLTAPRRTRESVTAISQDHAHFCEVCRCFVKITLWEMDQCPNCDSTDLKYAILWMRTPGEQQARSDAQRRKRFIKAINGGVPLPLPKPPAPGQHPLSGHGSSSPWPPKNAA